MLNYSYINMSNTTNISEFSDFGFYELDQGFKTFLVISLSLIIVIATLGNAAVLIGFFAYKKLRSNTNCFIISLSISDIIHALIPMPFEVEFLHESFDGWKHGVVICEFINTMFFVALSSSILSLLSVSLYRYITIAHPFYAEKIRCRHILLAVSAIWVYSLITSLLPVMGWRNHQTEIAFECLFDFSDGFFMYFYICNFFLPSLVMLLMYSMIFIIAQRHAKEIEKLKVRFSTLEDADQNQLEITRNRRRPMKRRLKAARTIGKIFLVYVICWMPYTLLLFAYMFCLQCAFSMPRHLHNVFALLAYSNTALNPLLFATWCHDFRAQMRRILRCGRKASSSANIPSAIGSAFTSRTGKATFDS